MDTKVVVITGASAGIGAALARILGMQGHRILLAARREQELNTVAKEIGEQALPVVTEVTRRSEVEHLKAAALERFGQIDVWVNNAGRGIGKKVLDLTDEDFDEMMRVNAKSALYGMQTIVPYFQERGQGHLINVSTFLSRVPFATYRSAYSAAKAALNSLTAILRVDVQATHPNVHVSLVMPGVVLTDFHKNVLGGTPPLPSSATANAQSAEEAAEAIAELIQNPRAEIYANPGSADILRRYYEDVDAFEANLVRRAP